MAALEVAKGCAWERKLEDLARVILGVLALGVVQGDPARTQLLP